MWVEGNYPSILPVSFRFDNPLFKVTAPSFKPVIRLSANQTTSERMSQSDERKYSFGFRSYFRANLVSVSSYFEFERRHSDFNAIRC